MFRQPEGDATAEAAVGAQVALDYIRRLDDDEVLARVNAMEIRWQEYEPLLLQTLLSLDQQYKLKWGDPAMQERLGHLQQQVLDQMIDRWLSRQVAADQGISFREDEIRTAVEADKARIEASDSYDGWKDYLAKTRFTEETYTDFVHDRLIYRALIEAQNVPVETEQVHIRYIAVSDQELAESIVAELEAGRSFEEMVEFSEDTESKEKGGDLGWFAREGMPPEFVSTVFALKEGEFTGVIESTTGYAIVQLLERAVRKLDEQQISQRQLTSLLSQVKAARDVATVEYLVSFSAE